MPGITQLLQVLRGIVKNSNGGSTTRTLKIETHISGTASAYYNSLLEATAHAVDGTALIAPSIGDSTAYPGTLTVSFVIPANKTIMYCIVGTDNGVTNYQAADADMTDDDVEVY
jgi:hypothetical protein